MKTARKVVGLLSKAVQLVLLVGVGCSAKSRANGEETKKPLLTTPSQRVDRAWASRFVRLDQEPADQRRHGTGWSRTRKVAAIATTKNALGAVTRGGVLGQRAQSR